MFYISILIGYVALVVGGGSQVVELYSPEGKCQHRLADLPQDILIQDAPVLMLLNKQIFSCGGNRVPFCYVYDISTDSWNSLSALSSVTHNSYPGSIYEGKIFMSHAKTPEIFDPTLNVWSTWPIPPIETPLYGCMVTLHDSFFLFGGYPGINNILQYSHTTKTWITLPKMPFTAQTPGCVVLRNQNILIDSGPFAVYDVSNNTWPAKYPPVNIHTSSTAFLLGKRVFSFTLYGILEYHQDNNTVTIKPFEPMPGRGAVPGVIALPAYMFSHLPGGCIGVM